MQVTPQVTMQVNMQVQKLLRILEGELNRQELQEKMGLLDKEYFRLNYLQPALESKMVEMIIPDKPTSSKQRFRITGLGN